MEKTGKLAAEKRSSRTQELEQKLAEVTETAKRVQAEFENYKKRVEKEIALLQEAGKRELVKKILPILDGFEQALKNKTTGEQFAQGMDMLFKEFHTVLEREGLKSISAIGKKFDPFEQEALSAEESEKEEGTVLEEFQKGYMFKEAVLRPAKVKISRQKKKEEQHENH